MDNPLDFLSGGAAAPADPAPAPEPIVDLAPAPAEPVIDPAPAPEGDLAPADPAEGQPRGPDGKFIAQPAADPVVAPPAPAEPGHVPIAALMDERDKRKAAERRTQELEDLQRASEGDPAEPQGLSPELLALNVKLDVSEEMARDSHGDEKVDAVKVWAQTAMATSPQLADEILTSRNPYKTAIKAYDEAQVVSQVREMNLSPADLTAFRAWQTAQANPAPQPDPAPPAPLLAAPAPLSPPPPPPRSIATAPSAGGTQHVPSGPGQAFDSVFSKG